MRIYFLIEIKLPPAHNKTEVPTIMAEVSGKKNEKSSMLRKPGPLR
jgi:hypothetical protein